MRLELSSILSRELWVSNAEDKKMCWVRKSLDFVYTWMHPPPGTLLGPFLKKVSEADPLNSEISLAPLS